MASTWTPWPATQYRLHFQDFVKKVATMAYWLAGVITDPTVVGPTQLRTKTAAVSDAALFEGELINRAERADDISPGTMTDTPYASMPDKARFEFVASDGSTAKMQLPTPLSTIMLSSDNTHVDMSNTDVAALVAYIQNATNKICTSAGIPLTNAVAKPAFRRRPTRLKNPLGRVA